MKTYSSFLVRCWTVAGPDEGERGHYHVTHFQSGEHVRTTDPERLREWIAALCRAARSSASPGEPEGRRAGWEADPDSHPDPGASG